VNKILVHEFMSLDGVIDTPSWTMEYGFDPKMGETIATTIMGNCKGLLMGRNTFEMFAQTWPHRTA
jgi:dihydrofolate reductase